MDIKEKSFQTFQGLSVYFTVCHVSQNKDYIDSEIDKIVKESTREA